jgi:hypothetical protein
VLSAVVTDNRPIGPPAVDAAEALLISALGERATPPPPAIASKLLYFLLYFLFFFIYLFIFLFIYLFIFYSFCFVVIYQSGNQSKFIHTCILSVCPS